MTTDQAKDLLLSLFVTFPHLDNYVDALPNPQGTITEWRRLVAKLDYETTAEAIRRLKDGEAEVPTKPWDIGMLPHFIRGVAGRVSDDRAKFARADALREAQRAARPGINSHAAAVFGRCRRIAMAAGACLYRDEISEQQNADIMRSLFGTNSELPAVPDCIRHEYDHPKDLGWHISKRKPLTNPIRTLH
jgi:hypothetical protein